ncbi:MULTISPECIES: ATP-grasp fold amidoligase family protein [Acinetobacter]|uniref:ATP-grasp fold amidoligase family protein n=1 Tax=Acinetobacter TaxID=469 RepID=UPI0004531D1D|nr:MULTISPECIES: ATP-grasp fold amidoligase family protein [Acinetobacter]EXB32975.1 tupA-like ATPgrasp family protein [Acinetobacter sp. 1461402]
MIKTLYRLIISKLPKKYRLALSYFRVFGVFPNIESPQNFNEKVLNRILYNKDTQFSLLADKYSVRKYIKEKIGEDYLIPLILCTENPRDLYHMHQWEQIVIKPNHGAGMVKVIDNIPSQNEKKQIVQTAEVWLKNDYSKVVDEWHYSLIKPKLLVEQKITKKNEALRDYKFHRFTSIDGSYRQILQVIAERSEQGYETVFFDVKDLDNILHSPFNYNLVLSLHEKEAIQKILRLNESLCTEYKYVRLDWYITKEKIYFGEITFTPGAGRSSSFSGAFGEEIGKLWLMK